MPSTDDPATTVLANTVAMPSPAVTRFNNRSNTSNVSLPTPDTVTSRPIRTNSGITVNRYSRMESLAAAPIIRMATISPRIKATPMNETVSMQIPIGMPIKINSKSAAIAYPPISKGVIARPRIFAVFAARSRRGRQILSRRRSRPKRSEPEGPCGNGGNSRHADEFARCEILADDADGRQSLKTQPLHRSG